MADDWDTVTKIGSKTSGGGSSQRETVVRGKGALNKAQRTGAIVATEKKFTTGNAVRYHPPFPFPPPLPLLFLPRPSPPPPPLFTNQPTHQPPPFSPRLKPKKKKQSTNKAPSEGQRLTKVDRADEIVVPQKTGPELGNAIRTRRSKDPYKMTQKELATAVNAPLADIKLLESGEGIKNQGLVNRVAKKLDISPKTGIALPGKE